MVWQNITWLSQINKQISKGEIDHNGLFRVRLTVIGFKSGIKSADGLKDCVYIYDSKTGASKPAKSGAALKSKTEQYVLALPLYVKDHTTVQSNQANIVHIMDKSTDSDDDSCFMPGITPQSLLKNKQSL